MTIKEIKKENDKIKELTISLEDFEKSMLDLIKSYRLNNMKKIGFKNINYTNLFDGIVSIHKGYKI